MTLLITKYRKLCFFLIERENFKRLYMDGLIAAIRKEDFVKNLEDYRSSPEENCLEVYNNTGTCM